MNDLQVFNNESFGQVRTEVRVSNEAGTEKVSPPFSKAETGVQVDAL